MLIHFNQPGPANRGRAVRSTLWHLACFAITVAILVVVGLLRQAELTSPRDAATGRVTTTLKPSHETSAPLALPSG
jgi:hypothetical protein